MPLPEEVRSSSLQLVLRPLNVVEYKQGMAEDLHQCMLQLGSVRIALLIKIFQKHHKGYH